MKSNAWMPLYVGDYLADTMHLTCEQHGAYMLLIMAYWRSGKPLPDDMAQLCAITKSSPENWEGLRPILAAFFVVKNGIWQHGRIDEELAASKKITKARSKAGKEGAAKRWQSDGKRIAEPLANASQNDAPSPSPKKKEDSGTDVPDGIAPSDPVKEIYNRGVLIFGEKRRSLLAKMVKRYGDPAVLAAIIETENANPIEPASYFIACCERRQVNGSGRGSAESAISKLGAWAMGPDEQESFRGHH